VAVLDTNFWLSTHVTTITMGYSAGLLASAFSHVYVIGRLVRGGKPRGEFFKSLIRMTYGVICFGLIFSVVGTILGGVWANESWGRFWGWDPKENGALMIVLWELFILHARMGGYIRDLGIAMAAIFGGMIVAFSWWGVNLLGIGLHSYGFTSGVMRTLMIFYIVELGVLGAGAFVAWRGNQARARMPRANTALAPDP
jgi:ABC-type transport system involved in cytochrome c biogenesis permease subunit